jgi:hypothetical protein
LEREEKKAEITSDDIFLLYDFMFILWMKGRGVNTLCVYGNRIYKRSKGGEFSMDEI